MEQPLDKLLKQIRSLSDEELDAVIAIGQQEKALRLLPPVHVTFQSMAEKLLECMCEPAQSTQDLKRLLSSVCGEPDGFDLVCQSYVMQPSDRLASLGEGPKDIQVVRCHPQIDLGKELNWPNVHHALHIASGEWVYVVKSSGSFLDGETLYRTLSPESLWREIRPSTSTVAAISAISAFSMAVSPTKESRIAVVDASEFDVSFLADVVETGKVFFSLKGGHDGNPGHRHVLAAWPNAFPLEAAEAQTVDILVSKVVATGQIQPLLEQCRSLLHSDSRVLLVAAQETVEAAPVASEIFCSLCVQEIRKAGLRPLELLTLQPFSDSAVIAATTKKRADRG